MLCILDEQGYFSEGNILDLNEYVNNVIYEHPISRKALKGRVPLWNEIVIAIELIEKYFPMMEYLGVDFVVTSKNQIKILEINSLTSLDAFQLRKTIMDTKGGEFFKRKLKEQDYK